MVNLEWYRTFKAVYQTGSLTAASRILFISQPNVSQHLCALEASIGKQLFERRPKLRPTDYGRLFYTHVVEPLEKLEEVETEFKAICLAKQLPVIRIGAFTEYFHSAIAGNFKHTPYRLQVSFGLTKELISRLLKGELDFVLATQLIADKSLTYDPVLAETFCIVAHPALNTDEFEQHIEQENYDMAEEWLLNQSWLAYSADLALIRRFWLSNFKKRPAIKPVFTIPDMNTILEIIQHDEGLSVTADYLVKERVSAGKLKVVWQGQVPATNTLYLAYDSSRVDDKQILSMKELLAAD